MSDESTTPTTSRRTVLGGLAALGALTATSAGAAGDETESETSSASRFPGGFEPDTPVETHHPGAPRFVAVDEPLVNPIWALGADLQGVDGDPDVPEWVRWEKGRDHLGPRLPELAADPQDYDATDFEWSLVEWPDDSDGPDEVLAFASSVGDVDRYDEGRDNVAEFQADAAGEYVLELDAPDGTHRTTVYAVEYEAGAGVYGPDAGDNHWGAPRIELEAESVDGEFVVHSNAQPAPGTASSEADLEVTYLADDRDDLDADAIEVDEDTLTATVSEDAIDDVVRVHAAAVDHVEAKASAQDVVELHPDGSVDLPNRPPEWLDDGVMYQLFPRSWAGERGETTFEVLIEGDDETGARGLDYLEELGVDVVWLTPVTPATSASRHDPDQGLYVGGGPHGYDTEDYTSIAADLVPEGYDDPVDAYRDFVDACHDRDIKVLFDIVVNHAGRTNDLFEGTIDQSTDPDGDPYPLGRWPIVDQWDTDHRAFDWWDRADVARYDDGERIEAAPRVAGFADLQVMPNLNYDNLALREYVLGVADFWSSPQSEGGVGVDGFRADIAYGVPHDVWKELREIVRANDGDFLMFDETIPADAGYSESQFSLHHDTDLFLNTVHWIAGDPGSDASVLPDTVGARAEKGIPDHSMVINALENHDEHRILNQAVVDAGDPDHDAITDEEWAAAARTVRGCWAAAVTLPGVPHVYYGQERQLSRYGEGRHTGEDDPRGYDDDGNVNPSADVRPGGRQRAFMNWDEYDEDHVQFYRDTIDLYHDLDVLQPHASLEDVSFDVHETDAEVLAFGRDATHLGDVDGPERAIVVVNFEPDPVTVDLVGEADTWDYFDETDVDAGSDGATTTVEVDNLVVVETDAFGVAFDLAAQWEDEIGDDHGPGWYEYPTADDFDDGAFDLVGVEVHESETGYRFALEVDDLTDPWDGEAGYSVQYVQLYVRDPALPDAAASEWAAPGVNAQFEAPCHRRIHATGEWGAWVDDGTGEFVVDATTNGDLEANEILVDVPADAFESDLEELELVPLLLGFEGFEDDGVRRVTAEGGEWVFEDTAFGEAADDTRHNVVDAVTPAGIDDADALGYDETSHATIPLLDGEAGVRNTVVPGDLVEAYHVGAGTDDGPGDYVYPENVPEGSLDVEAFEIYESHDAYTFVFRMVDDLENPWDFEPGFSYQHPQVYLRDPDADDGSTDARNGVNATLEAPHQVRVSGSPEDPAFETADGDSLAGYVLDSYHPDREIALRVQQDELDADVDDLRVAAFMCGHDGFGTGNVRAVLETATDWEFGGADPVDTAPNVLDVVTPEGVDDADALAYDANSLAELPYVDPTDAGWWAPYTDENGVASSASDHVLPAIGDFQATGDPGAAQLVTLIESFETGTPVPELD